VAADWHAVHNIPVVYQNLQQRGIINILIRNSNWCRQTAYDRT